MKTIPITIAKNTQRKYGGGGAAGDTWGREGDVDMAEVTWLQASSAPGRIWNHGIDT